jgi:hypothetical protein
MSKVPHRPGSMKSGSWNHGQGMGQAKKRTDLGMGPGSWNNGKGKERGGKDHTGTKQ